jgi:hypothetical protein
MCSRRAISRLVRPWATNSETARSLEVRLSRPTTAAPYALANTQPAQGRSDPRGPCSCTYVVVPGLRLNEKPLRILRLISADKHSGCVLTCTPMVECSTALASQLGGVEQSFAVTLEKASAAQGGAHHGGDLGRQSSAGFYDTNDVVSEVDSTMSESEPYQGRAEIAVVVADLALDVVLPEAP